MTRAVEFEREWPIIGGIEGTELSLKQIISIGVKVLGMSKLQNVHVQKLTFELIGSEPFILDKVKLHGLETGEWSASWLPKADHPAISPAMANRELAKLMAAGIIGGMSAGCFKASDEWNRLLPDYKFTQAAVFLAEAWRGKL